MWEPQGDFSNKWHHKSNNSQGFPLFGGSAILWHFLLCSFEIN